MIFIIKNIRFSTNTFCSTSFFLKGSFEAKKSNMEELEIKDLFFANYFFPLIVILFLKPFINY
jgi:hypothetical protein